MNLPKFSVSRPVFTTMVTLIVVILGAVSLQRLRIDLLPNIELPTLSIRTNYGGASPEVMEQMVSQVVEEIVAVVPGIEEITSSSYEGYSDVRVRFGWGTNIDTAALDVQARIEDEIGELPSDVRRPRVNKFDINAFPVVILGISSELDPVDLTQLLEEQIRQQFARIPGVAQVDIWGGFNREIRVELNADRINALGLPLDRILAAIEDSNLDLPAGQIDEGHYEVTLRAPAQFVDLDELRDTVLLIRDGAAITLGQVAEVLDTYTRPWRIIRVNGVRGLRVAIRKEADANTVEVAKAVLAAVDTINADFPQVNIVPVSNQGDFIERSIANVARSVFYGGGLAIVVLLFFLRNLRSTLVISLSIPISIIATFALIFFSGFTLNLMTLGGLALGVGMMVDSSIVVLENIFRHRDEEGKPPLLASVDAAREVGPAIVASTITTLVIFLPLVFMRGVSGVLFQELAYVIAFSLMCSLLVSLSLVPMLASRLLNDRSLTPHSEAPGMIRRLGNRIGGYLKRMEEAYSRLLRWVLRRRWMTLGISVGLLVLSLQLRPLIGSELLPPSDEGEVRINGRMDAGTRLEVVDEQVLRMKAIIDENVPEVVSSVVSSQGGSGSIQLSLPAISQRARSNVEVADDLRALLEGEIAGMEVRVHAPQGQFLLNRLLGDGGDDSLTVEVRGFDLDVLAELSEQVLEQLRDVVGITDAEIRQEDQVPQHQIQVDRAKIADLGLSVREVTRVLGTAISGSEAGEFRTGGNSYRILVRMADAEQMTLDEVLGLTLSTPSGEQVAFRNLVSSVPGVGPPRIDRKQQQRVARITANISGRDLGSIATEVEDRLRRIARPDGYVLQVTGSFEEQQEASRELMMSLLLAVVLVYMVLACQYESLRSPLVVMFSVPMATIGVLVTLFLTHTTLNLQSYIGCIMLGGIVVNNAILLVDQAGQLKDRGMAVTDAVAEAGRRRLRPILMTTLTTVLGLMPLALGIGEGADAQAPLARAVVGGLLGSTLITLVLIPAMYSLFNPDRHSSAS